jgi:hypothetical protein
MSPQAIISRVLSALSRPARAKTPELGIKEKQVQAALLRAQLQRRAPKGRTLKIRIETSPSDVEKDGYIDFWVSMSPERHGKAKARSRMRQVTVNFLPHTEQPPDWRKDYLRQIRGQERGINAMNVGQWSQLRSLFLARAAATGSGRHDQSDNVQRRARRAKEAELRDMLAARLVPYYMARHGLSKTAALAKARDVARGAAAKRFLNLAALHDPDQVAGGRHDRIGGVPIDEFTQTARDRSKQLRSATRTGAPIDPGDTTAMPEGFGLLDVNSSLGSQWKDQVARVESVAKQRAQHNPDDSMNVRLYPKG